MKWLRSTTTRARDRAVELAYHHDHAISEELAREAAESGSPRAMTVYGIGLGDLGRTEEAVRWLERAAAAGDPLAPAALAALYWDREDALNAAEWLRTTETRQGPLDSRISLLQAWGRSTVPFDHPPRPPGPPTTDAHKGRAAERGGGVAPAEWAEFRRKLIPRGETDASVLFLYAEVAMRADALFAAAAETMAGPTPADWPQLKGVLRPDSAMTLELKLSVGALAARAGDLASAEEWFAAAARDGDAKALLFRAEVHRDRYDTRQALPYFKAASDAGNAEAGYVLGHWYADQGDHRTAERYYRRAADAGHRDAWLNLGVSLRQLDRYDEAEHCYERAIELGEFADGWNNLGNLKRHQGRMTEAEWAWRKAAAAGSGPALASLGACHFQRGDLREAEGLLRRSAEAGDPSGMFNLAILLTQTGRMTEAADLLRRTGSPPPTPPQPTPAYTTPPPQTTDRDAVTRWLSGAERGGATDPAVEEALRRLRGDGG